MTTRYVPLLSIVAEHGFFPSGTMGNFRLLPTPRCAALIDKFGMLLRAAPSGVDLYCQLQDRTDLLAGMGVEPGMALEFRGFSSDPQFSTFTELGPRTMDETVFVARAGAAPGPDGRICLHDGDSVTGADLRKNDSPEIVAMLGRNFDPVKPSFFVSIQFHDFVNAVQQQAPGGNLAAPVFYLRFAARKSVWKYYFLNDVDGKDIVIVDLDGRARFSQRGATPMPGRRDAVTFVSDDAIDMQKTYTQRFQLRERGALGERILIKRLPNASVYAVGRELLEGSAVAVLVSEIYIN